jgi:hypothetical protein
MKELDPEEINEFDFKENLIISKSGSKKKK